MLRGVDLGHRDDALRLAVLGDGEVVRRQSADRAAVLVEHRDVEADDVDVAAEDRRLLLRLGRILDRRIRRGAVCAGGGVCCAAGTAAHERAPTTNKSRRMKIRLMQAYAVDVTGAMTRYFISEKCTQSESRAARFVCKDAGRLCGTNHDQRVAGRADDRVERNAAIERRQPAVHSLGQPKKIDVRELTRATNLFSSK